MLLDYDPKTALRHWPRPMNLYGKTPQGENLFRIIFAPTRKHLIGGVWADGVAEYRYGCTYRSLGDQWVLERWVPGFEFALMSKKDWTLKWTDPQTGLLLQGPYPDKGDYQHAFTFEACDPGNANIDKLVMWVEAGRKRSRAEINQAVNDDYEADTRNRRSTMDAIIRNVMPEHLGSTVGPFVGRVGKTLNTPKTAEQLGLPMSPNKFIAGNPQRTNHA